MKKSALTNLTTSFFLSVGFFLSNLFLPLLTVAATSITGLHFQFINPLGIGDGFGTGTKDLPTLVDNVLKAAVILLGPVVTIMLLYSGFLFVTAQGNVENLTKAKKALMYSLIGAALVLGARGLSLVVQNAIGCLGNAPGC